MDVSAADILRNGWDCAGRCHRKKYPLWKVSGRAYDCEDESNQLPFKTKAGLKKKVEKGERRSYGGEATIRGGV